MGYVEWLSHSLPKSRPPRFAVRPVERNRFSRCLPIGLFHTTAANLPYLVDDHDKVMAMVASEASAAGVRLRPVFELFATNRPYADITFV